MKLSEKEKLQLNGSNWVVWSAKVMAYLVTTCIAAKNAIRPPQRPATRDAPEAPIDHEAAISYIIRFSSDELIPVFMSQNFTTGEAAWKWLEDKFGKVSSVVLLTHVTGLCEPYDGSIDKFDARTYINLKIEHRRIYNENVVQGDKISERFLCESIMSGLPREFNSMLTSLDASNKDKWEIQPLTDLIITTEARIKSQAKRGGEKIEFTENTVNAAINEPHRGGYRGGGRGGHRGGRNGPSGGRGNNGGGAHPVNGGAHKPNRGGRRGGFRGRGRRKCYGCGKMGHIRESCWTNPWPNTNANTNTNDEHVQVLARV